MNPKRDLQKLYEDMRTQIGALYTDRELRLVFGDGDPKSPVVLVGEAPGEREALEGKPFVGKAGKQLTAFLEGTGLLRSQLFITNVVKFRPTKQSKAGNTVNRPPTAEEIALFTPWLAREMELIAPKVIVTLGNVPLRAVSGQKGVVIGAVHGQPFPGGGMGCALFPLYHPAAVIYNRALVPEYEADLQKLRAFLNE